MEREPENLNRPIHLMLANNDLHSTKERVNHDSHRLLR